MDDAALIFCLRESRLDRLADLSQPVSADNQDILNPTVLKAVEDGQPVLSTLVIADLDRQDIFLSFAADPIIPNGVVDCIDVEDGVGSYPSRPI